MQGDRNMSPTTARALIDELSKYPPDMEVVTPGFDEGPEEPVKLFGVKDGRLAFNFASFDDGGKP